MPVEVAPEQKQGIFHRCKQHLEENPKCQGHKFALTSVDAIILILLIAQNGRDTLAAFKEEYPPPFKQIKCFQVSLKANIQQMTPHQNSLSRTSQGHGVPLNYGKTLNPRKERCFRASSSAYQ